jgi:hypothetical protein
MEPWAAPVRRIAGGGCHSASWSTDGGAGAGARRDNGMQQRYDAKLQRYHGAAADRSSVASGTR